MRLVARTALMLLALAVATDARGQTMWSMPPPDLQAGYVMQPGQELYGAPQQQYLYGPSPIDEHAPYRNPIDSQPGVKSSSASDDDWPDWYADIGFVALWQEIVFDNRPAIQLDPGFGPRLAIGTRPTIDNELEAEYFGVFGVGSSERDALAGLEVEVRYKSELQNAEVNFVHCWGNFALLGGFRFVQLADRFEIDAIGGGVSQVYKIRATNDLFGAQIGFRWRQCWKMFFFEELGKAGLFGNAIADNQAVTVGHGYVSRSASADGTSAAFVGDVNISVGMQLSNTWLLRCGYSAMWIDDVALSPSQIDFTSSRNWGTVLNHGDRVFLQGVIARLEAQW